MWNTSWPVNLYLIIPTSKEHVDVEKVFMYNLHEFLFACSKPVCRPALKLRVTLYIPTSVWFEYKHGIQKMKLLPTKSSFLLFWRSGDLTTHLTNFDLNIGQLYPQTHQWCVYYFFNTFCSSKKYVHTLTRKKVFAWVFKGRLHLTISDALWHLNWKFCRLCWTSMLRTRWEMATGATAQKWISNDVFHNKTLSKGNSHLD